MLLRHVMGKAVEPERVKLVIGMLARDELLFEKSEEFFIKEFGDIDYRSAIRIFDYTSHYEKEFGVDLKRKFISFKKHIHPGEIPEIKIATNYLEQKFAVQKDDSINRQINIDPGYISLSHLVLLTTKPGSHRIYLSAGIYANLELLYVNKAFRPLEWTYPDYRSKGYIDFFNSVRADYHTEVKWLLKEKVR